MFPNGLAVSVLLQCHSIYVVVIFHPQFLQCLSVLQANTIKQTMKLSPAQTLARAVYFKQRFQLACPSDPEVPKVADVTVISDIQVYDCRVFIYK